MISDGVVAPKRRSAATSAVMMVLTLLCAAVIPMRIDTALAANLVRNQDDFQTFYRTARCLFVEPRDPYAHIEGVNPNLAPPHAHLLLAPVIALPQRPAYLAWLAMSLLILAVAGTGTIRAVHADLDWSVVALAVIVIAGSALTIGLIASGQIYAALAGVVAWAWLSFRDGRTMAAAVLNGLGAAIKPMLLLPAAWFLFNNQWRAAIVTVGTVIGISAIGLAWFGVGPYAEWLDTLSHLPLEATFETGRFSRC